MSTPSILIADRYRLINLLGTGGMGVVWQAWDERLRRAVALKMLRTQPELTDREREVATERAMREARITAGLHHPHAVTVFDVVEHEGQPCIVMQFIESTPLSVLLREHGPLTPRETARIGAEVGSALAAAHKLRIVHRDVKPGNILITEDGSAMISDFGISHALGDTTITGTGMMHGTPAYLAPEVARGKASSFASDVFSLGSTLYAMLEGTPPFGVDNNAIALLHRVGRGAYPGPQNAGALAPLLDEMLSADPKRRPAMSSVASGWAAMYGGTDAAAAEWGTGPLAGAGAGAGAVAAAGGARDGDRPATAETRPVGATTETERLDEATAETERLDEPTAVTERAEEPEVAAPAASETEDAAGIAAFDAVVAPARNRPTPPPRARPIGHRGGPPPPREVEPGPQPNRRRRTAAMIGVFVLAGILLLGGGALLIGLLGQNSGTASDTTADETRAATPTATETATASPPAETPDAQPAPAVPSPPQEAPPPAASAEQRIVDAITSYYAMLPSDLDSAWPMMTADYQVNHVGGRDAYGAFWGEVAQVEIADVTPSPPDAAQATLTYHFTDGSVVQEVTAYRLVDEGGVLKIAATEVLSSVEL
ncbi:serine/threonine-protein kinase [Agromyces sp. Marseille-P2726]|uniref:serine/threonine-protein kinase n=1 Tax=Agromyces sp. Marseille-P2726 TaxID=2709132 RepID=UPI00156E750A|nr:serine/threonine-protein kinase [Agromyces sp. Marseille-P2726]